MTYTDNNWDCGSDFEPSIDDIGVPEIVSSPIEEFADIVEIARRADSAWADAC